MGSRNASPFILASLMLYLLLGFLGFKRQNCSNWLNNIGLPKEIFVINP